MKAHAKALERNGTRYVAIRRVVENMGMSWGSQRLKLDAQPAKFRCVDINTHDSSGRRQDMFCMPIDIRKLIERNRLELEAFGVCPAVGQTSGAKGGRPATEYFLNEEQALLIAAVSDVQKAHSAPRVCARPG